MISYEIAMGLALVGVVLTYGTLRPAGDGRAGRASCSGAGCPRWGIFYQPLGFIIFFVAGIAESKRIPFDLPESESELVSGYFTEYSGAKHLHVHDVRLRRGRAGRGARHHALLRRLAGAVARRATASHFPWGTHIALPSIVVAVLQIVVVLGEARSSSRCFQIVSAGRCRASATTSSCGSAGRGCCPLALVNVVADGRPRAARRGRAREHRRSSWCWRSLTIASALVVVVHRNPVYSALGARRRRSFLLAVLLPRARRADGRRAPDHRLRGRHRRAVPVRHHAAEPPGGGARDVRAAAHGRRRGRRRHRPRWRSCSSAIVRTPLGAPVPVHAGFGGTEPLARAALHGVPAAVRAHLAAAAGRDRRRGRASAKQESADAMGDGADLLVPRPQRRALRDRRGGRAHAPQPDRHLHGDRAAC